MVQMGPEKNTNTKYKNASHFISKTINISSLKVFTYKLITIFLDKKKKIL